MASFHAIAPTQRFSPPCRAAAGTTHHSPSPPGPRRGHGVAAPGVRGAATRAGSRLGPPRPPPEPQGRRRAGGGRDGLQTPSPGGAARGAATLGPDAADTPPELGRPGLRSVRNFSRPSLSRPLQLLPASGLPALEGRDPGQGRSANSRPPRRSAQPIRNALASQGPSTNYQPCRRGLLPTLLFRSLEGGRNERDSMIPAINNILARLRAVCKC